MLVLYSAAMYVLTPLFVLRLLWLGMRFPAYRPRWRERFGFPPPVAGNGPVLLVHAVSVGEVAAARPLVGRILAEYPGYRVVLSTVTPTGAQAAARAFGDGVRHLYFPWDIPAAVDGFLNRVRPAAVIVLETELWPNFYLHCNRRGIPVMLVNARMSERSARGYARLRGLARTMLRSVTLVAAQSDADAARFRKFGAEASRVMVCGNLKFDVNLAASVKERGAAIRRTVSAGRPAWIAASTHDGEEAQVLAAFAGVRARFPQCLLFLAPRHPQRFSEAVSLCREAGYAVARHSEARLRPPPGTAVYVIDTIGDLPDFYAASDAAFVGGSLVPAGGHNLLEPACLGIPILCGPHTFNFADVGARLAGAGALRVVGSAGTLARELLSLLGDANLRHGMGERARAVFEANRGATERLMAELRPVLEQ